MPKLSSVEAVKQLDALTGGDPEAAHAEADEILIKFLQSHYSAHKEIAEAWLRASERLGFWYA